MRIPKAWIPPMAKRVVDAFLEEELIVPDVDRGRLLQEVEAIILNELSAEDRLNDEVREILKKYEAEFASGRADYRKMFELTKKQLVKDRGIIL